MVSILIVPTLYPHSMSLAVAPLLIYAVYSVDWVGPVTAYVALFIGVRPPCQPQGGGSIACAAVSSLLVYAGRVRRAVEAASHHGTIGTVAGSHWPR